MMNIKPILTKHQVKRLKLMLKNTLYTKYKIQKARYRYLAFCILYS